MESTRWKNASLAISSIIRGLELDQIEFLYDDAAGQETVRLAGGRAASSDVRAERTRDYARSQ